MDEPIDENAIPPTQTSLDEAMEIARRNPEQANFFFDALLNTPIFVPVKREGAESGNWVSLTPADKFQPLFMKTGETKVIPIFDTLPRLKEWARDRAFDYLEIKCHILVQITAASIAIQVNLGTPWTYHLSSEVLEELRKAMRPVSAS